MKILIKCIFLILPMFIGSLAAQPTDSEDKLNTPKTNPSIITDAKDANTTQASTTSEQKFKVGEFCWNELATSDVKAAKDFYGNVFGWKFSEHKSGDMTYTMVSKNDEEFAGIWAIPKDQEKQIPPHWLAYIFVDNIEQALEKAVKYGATTLKPIANAGEYGRFAVIKDPTGAHVALWQPLKAKP